MWGYETGPALTPEQIIRSKYRGRAHGFGYPACPDHSLKREVFDLLAADKTTAMRLNDNYMITPEEALCGLFLRRRRIFLRRTNRPRATGRLRRTPQHGHRNDRKTDTQ